MKIHDLKPTTRNEYQEIRLILRFNNKERLYPLLIMVAAFQFPQEYLL